jgi:hypothetical protein
LLGLGICLLLSEVLPESGAGESGDERLPPKEVVLLSASVLTLFIASLTVGMALSIGSLKVVVVIGDVLPFSC